MLDGRRRRKCQNTLKDGSIPNFFHQSHHFLRKAHFSKRLIKQNATHRFHRVDSLFSSTTTTTLFLSQPSPCLTFQLSHAASATAPTSQPLATRRLSSQRRPSPQRRRTATSSEVVGNNGRSKPSFVASKSMAGASGRRSPKPFQHGKFVRSFYCFRQCFFDVVGVSSNEYVSNL